MDRLQTGHLRDPLIASGVLVGLVIVLASFLFSALLIEGFTHGGSVFLPRVDALSGIGYSAGLLVFDFARSFGGGIALLVLIVLARLLLRRMWLADIVAAAVIGVVIAGVQPWLYRQYFVVALSRTALAFAMLFALRRFGWLSLWVMTGVSFYLATPMALTSWYAGRSLATLLFPAVIATWALWVILSDKRGRATESAG